MRGESERDGELGWGGQGESWQKGTASPQSGLCRTSKQRAEAGSTAFTPQSWAPERGDQPHTLKPGGCRLSFPIPFPPPPLAIASHRSKCDRAKGGVCRGRDAWRRASLPSLALSKTVLATIFSSSIDKLGRDARQRAMGSFQRHLALRLHRRRQRGTNPLPLGHSCAAFSGFLRRGPALRKNHRLLGWLACLLPSLSLLQPETLSPLRSADLAYSILGAYM